MPTCGASANIGRRDIKVSRLAEEALSQLKEARHTPLHVSLKRAPHSPDAGQPGSSAGIAGLIGHFDRVDISHQGAQPVELVEDMQDDRNAFVVDAKVQLEIPDQPGPCEIGIGELNNAAT